MGADRSLKDILTGAIFIAAALGFGLTALGYPIGTAFKMGPGYFPLVLAGLLATIGVATVVTGLTQAGAGSDLGVIPWRGAALVLGALVFFGVTVQGIGLVPCVFLVVFATATASARATWVGSLLLAAGMTLFCVAVFVWGLGVQLPTFGPWLGGLL